MGKVFTLTADIRQIAQDAIDDLLDQLGKACRLYYPPRLVPCGNCIYDPIGHKSSNRWIDGGPVPFGAGSVCPLCSGEGRCAQEVTETITMLVASAPAHFWVKGPAGVEVPAGTIQTKAYLKDLPKILMARSMVLQPELEAIIRWRYALDGEPVDAGNIIQGRYVICQWKRAG
jgi:hypothetical protein